MFRSSQIMAGKDGGGKSRTSAMKGTASPKTQNGKKKYV